MFICGVCGSQSDPKVKPLKVITETRRVEYLVDPKSQPPKVTQGWEISKEIDCCVACGSVGGKERPH